jgi:ADP-ribose pyrophosphatase
LRELEEETGFVAGDIVKIGSFYPSVGITNQIGHIFLAENLTQSKQNLDESEIIKLNWIPIDKAIEMVMNGNILHVGAAYAILVYSNLKSK